MKIPICKGSTGINTENDPARSQYDPSIGLSDLAACMNIDISNAFRPSRRKGINKLISGPSHSLFPVNKQYCLFVNGNRLCGLLPNLSEYITITTIDPVARVSYLLLDNIVYYVNGLAKGKVVNGICYPWTRKDYVGNIKTKVISDPPAGSFIAYYNGRVYIAVGAVIWYSIPYAPDLFLFGTQYLSLESNIRMIMPVDNGMYISDEYTVWFVSGNDPNKFKWNMVSDYPALPYSNQPCNGKIRVSQEGERYFVGGGEMGAIWLTNRGLCFGGPDGSFHNLTDEKIDMPGEYGSGACLINKTTVIGQFN